jgi:hypothetical protein
MKLGHTIERTEDLGLGLKARLVIEVCEPNDPPESGSDWKQDLDYPVVQGSLFLPAEPDHSPLSRQVDDALLSDAVVLGCRLDYMDGWGERSQDHIVRIIHDRKPRVEEALAEVDRQLTEAVGIARTIAHAREARLARRERTIALALGESTQENSTMK